MVCSAAAAVLRSNKFADSGVSEPLLSGICFRGDLFVLPSLEKQELGEERGSVYEEGDIWQRRKLSLIIGISCDKRAHMDKTVKSGKRFFGSVPHFNAEEVC